MLTLISRFAAASWEKGILVPAAIGSTLLTLVVVFVVVWRMRRARILRFRRVLISHNGLSSSEYDEAIESIVALCKEKHTSCVCGSLRRRIDAITAFGLCSVVIDVQQQKILYDAAEIALRRVLDDAFRPSKHRRILVLREGEDPHDRHAVHLAIGKELDLSERTTGFLDIRSPTFATDALGRILD